MNYQKALRIVSSPHQSSFELDRAQGYLLCHAKAQKLVEALEKTLAALVSYKKYVPEPYKQNPIYIIGSHEAEKEAIEILDEWHKENKEG